MLAALSGVERAQRTQKLQPLGTIERGGAQYNLALGQKRATAVRKSLAVPGATDSQVEAVSLGESRPAATETDDAAWAKDRRSAIVH